MSFSERAFQWLARILFAAVVTLASMYLLLANVAVANQWIVRSPIFGWIPGVVRWFPAVYLGAAILMVAALVWRSRNSTRIWIFAAAQIVLVTSLQYFAVLAHADPGTTTLVWSFLILGSLIWIGTIDLAGAKPPGSVASGAQGFSIRGAIIAAAFVVIGHFLLGPSREFFGAGGNAVRRWDMLAMLPLSFLGHIALFLLVYVIAVVVSRIAEWIWRSDIQPMAALHLTIAIFAFILFRQIVLPSLLFTGWQATLYGLVLPFALSFYVAAARSTLRDRNGAAARRRVSEWQIAAVYFAGIAAFAYGLSHAVPIFDWNFLFQKLGVFCVWIAVFYLFQRLSRPEPNSILYIVVACALGIAGMRTFATVTQSWKLSNFALTEYMNEATTEYLKRDSSFHALRDLARGSRTNTSNEQFYKYLAENSNVTGSKAFAPETSLVEHLEPTKQPRPNIFLFVVDSMRPDYLSPYNKAVSFTPAIGAFARESVTVRNAFTQYGGTVLAEPAFWTGTMQFHQQFIPSFAPINSLKKLLQADGYESWVSVDLVIQYVVDPEFQVKRLNASLKEWDQLDLCDTLTEVQVKMDSHNAKDPLFVFVQAQNTHQFAIQRRQKSPPPPFPGFDPRTAYEVQKLDHCFGKFIDYLKAKGVYENSIVILTSDHGDEFFEHGNFGHVGSLYPEVLRVPLLVHLPKASEDLVIDQRAASFTTDITPTLYYLLGHGVVKKNPVFGRTLFARSEEELRAAESPYYMVASSYAPIYGILDQWGESLYIADALNKENYFFDLAHDPQAKENKITFDLQVKNEGRIAEKIDAIAEFYHYKNRSRAATAVAAVPVPK